MFRQIHSKILSLRARLLGITPPRMKDRPSEPGSVTGVQLHEVTPDELRVANVAPNRRFTVPEYRRLVDSGAIHPAIRTELLWGMINEKLPCSPRHETTVARTAEILQAVISDEWVIRQKSGVTMDESEVAPDIAVVAGPITRFEFSHPRPHAVELLIEVSDRTIRYDRWKLGAYAANGISQIWIVNLIENRVEVFRHPSGPTESHEYETRDDHNIGDSIPLVINGRALGTVAVDEILAGI